MDPVARGVCIAVGGKQLLGPDGVMPVVQVLRDNFAPEAIDSKYQHVVRFLHFKRAEKTMGLCLARFDLPRREAESWIRMGGLSPETSAPISRMQNASLSELIKRRRRPACRGIWVRLRRQGKWGDNWVQWDVQFGKMFRWRRKCRQRPRATRATAILKHGLLSVKQRGICPKRSVVGGREVSR